MKYILLSIVILYISCNKESKENYEVNKEKVDRPGTENQIQVNIKYDYDEISKEFSSFGDDLSLIKEKINTLKQNLNSHKKANEQYLESMCYQISYQFERRELFDQYRYLKIRLNLIKIEQKIIKYIQNGNKFVEQ